MRTPHNLSEFLLPNASDTAYKLDPRLDHRLLLETYITPTTMFAIRSCNRVACSLASSTVRAFSTARPFSILGIQQVAVGSLDKKPLSDLWGEIFGLEKVGSFSSESENVDEDIMKLGKGPFAVEVDLMTPLDAEKSPKVHSPALNHIGLWVDDLDTAVDWMKDQGKEL
jgi:hypothetical protein